MEKCSGGNEKTAFCYQKAVFVEHSGIEPLTF